MSCCSLQLRNNLVPATEKIVDRCSLATSPSRIELFDADCLPQFRDQLIDARLLGRPSISSP
jgi:hypothetical protein